MQTIQVFNKPMSETDFQKSVSDWHELAESLAAWEQALRDEGFDPAEDVPFREAKARLNSDPIAAIAGLSY